MLSPEVTIVGFTLIEYSRIDRYFSQEAKARLTSIGFTYERRVYLLLEGSDASVGDRI